MPNPVCACAHEKANPAASNPSTQYCQRMVDYIWHQSIYPALNNLFLHFEIRRRAKTEVQQTFQRLYPCCERQSDCFRGRLRHQWTRLKVQKYWNQPRDRGKHVITLLLGIISVHIMTRSRVYHLVLSNSSTAFITLFFFLFLHQGTVNQKTRQE